MSDVILRCTCYPMTYLSHLSHHIDMFYTYSNTELQRRQDSVVRYISIQSPLPYHSYPRLQDLAMPISINLIKYMSHHFYQHYTHYDYQCYQCLFLSRPFLSILNAAPGQVCTYSTELPASTLSQRARRCSQPLRWAGHSAVLGNRHYPYICIYIYIYIMHMYVCVCIYVYIYIYMLYVKHIQITERLEFASHFCLTAASRFII